MKISNFDATGLEKIDNYLAEKEVETLTEETIKELLKTANISFIAEGINRVQSTLLCELKDSYVQQSQRYVTMGEASYTLPNNLSKADKEQAEELIAQVFKLYNQMSKLKDEEFKGRPKVEHYQYGIPIEDARYIFPLAVKTNISVAMSGDKLYNLFKLFNKQSYGDLFKLFKDKLSTKLPHNIVKLLNNSIRATNKKEKELVTDYYQSDLEQLTTDNRLIFLEAVDDLDLRVGLGAATSTSKKQPSQKLKEWGTDSKKRSQALAKRVLGYGHESIAEQARTTFAMICSLVTYHQQIRHRLPKNYREELSSLIRAKDRAIMLPPRIAKSDFKAGFLDLVDQIKEFRVYLADKYDASTALYFLLNCDQIKLITATNARIDLEILAERICLNSQWEIRGLATKKLDKLRELSDILYEKALPSCIYGDCKEGKLSCGKQQKMRDKFLID